MPDFKDGYPNNSNKVKDLPAAFSGLSSNLKLWLDASDATAVKMDESNNVSQWYDWSGKRNHALPNALGERPSTVTEAGKTYLTFDVSNKESLALGSSSQLDFGDGQDFTYVVAYKTDTVTASGVYETALLSKRSGSNGYQLYLRNSQADALTFIGSGSEYNAIGTDSSHKDNQLHIVTATFDRDGKLHGDDCTEIRPNGDKLSGRFEQGVFKEDEVDDKSSDKKLKNFGISRPGRLSYLNKK